MPTGVMNVSNLSALIPYAIQFLLAIICVAAIQKLKLYDRFPYLADVTDRANALASVALALLIAAAFHAKELIMGMGSGQNLLWAAKDAAVQWGIQETIYRVGLKNALKGFFSMLGLGPANKTATQDATAKDENKNPPVEPGGPK